MPDANFILSVEVVNRLHHERLFHASSLEYIIPTANTLDVQTQVLSLLNKSIAYRMRSWAEFRFLLVLIQQRRAP